MMSSSKVFLGISICICLTILSHQAFSQASGPPPPPPIASKGPNIPIDGGIGLLLAAGIAYGVKKLHDSRKKGTSS